MMFLPQRPYLRIGSLRAALAYPLPPRAFGDKALRAALERTGLGHLGPLLGERQHWYRELSVGEQQCIAFARMLLHRPQWVFLGEAIDLLDENHRQQVLSVFEQELAGTSVISIRRRPARDRDYTQVLHLLKSDVVSVGTPVDGSKQAGEGAAWPPAGSARPDRSHLDADAA
jgi:putative ATP-binding cassette transporter